MAEDRLTWSQQVLLKYWDSLPLVVQETAPQPVLDDLRTALRIERAKSIRTLLGRRFVRMAERIEASFAQMGIAARQAAEVLDRLGLAFTKVER